MKDELSSAVCLTDSCVEIINTYNPYARYIGMIIQVAIVVAIGIAIIAIIKRKSTKKVDIQKESL